MHTATRTPADAAPTASVCRVCGEPFATAAARDAHYRGAGLLD